MKIIKFFVIASLLIGLIFLSSIGVINSYRLVITTNSSESQNLSLKSNIRDGYAFIWDEYIGAPGDQQGDDSVVYGASFGPYHNYSELVKKLWSLNTTYPEIIQVFTIGKTYFGLDIYCVQITNESITLPKTEVLIIGQHHAQEQISVENSLYFIDKIVYDFYSSSTAIQNILNTKTIYVIPSLNIDGAEILSQNPWQRKTLRPIDEDGDGVEDEYEVTDINKDGYVDELFDGSNNFIGFEGIDLDGDGRIGNDKPGGVDPNRNYAYQFGKQPGASDNPSAWNYHGPYPFSENCTAKFRDFVLQRKFITAVSLHSGMDYTMILGPSTQEGLLYGVDKDLYLSTGAKLQDLTGFSLEIEGPGYATSGVWDDWMYSNGTLLAFTFETYGNPSAYYSIYNSSSGYYHYRGVWDYCNPPGNKVMDNCIQTYQGLLFMVQEAPYLTIQTTKKQIGEQLQIKVTVSNPSAYIRTNGSIILNWTISQVIGLTPLNTTHTVNLGEIYAESQSQTTLLFSIDQSNYSLNIKLWSAGSRVGTIIKEYDLNSIPQVTESSVSIALIGVIGLMIYIMIRKKIRGNQKGR